MNRVLEMLKFRGVKAGGAKAGRGKAGGGGRRRTLAGDGGGEASVNIPTIEDDGPVGGDEETTAVLGEATVREDEAIVGGVNIGVDNATTRFPSAAYLQQIWWFEVDGKINFPFPAGSYSVYLRLQLGKPSKRFGWKICNTEQVHGWDTKPVRFQLWTEDGQHSSSQCMLTETGKWNHHHVGNFVVGKSKSSSTKLKFSMTQIDCTHTKGRDSEAKCYPNLIMRETVKRIKRISFFFLV